MLLYNNWCAGNNWQQLYPNWDMVECTGEFGLELDLEHVRKEIRMEVQGCQIEKLEDEVRKQRWQGCLVTIRLLEWVWMGVFGG